MDQYKQQTAALKANQRISKLPVEEDQKFYKLQFAKILPTKQDK
jgi:hypothetical protein